jgi:hypothetical protein
MSPSDTLEAITPLVAELERLGVAYYIGGSVVSSMHGIPRSTLDIDVVADLSPKHVPPLVHALKSLYYIDAGMIQDAIARRSCFNLIHLATSFKVDVFAVKNRPYDRVVIERTRKSHLDAANPGAQFFFASPEDIVLAKLEWYRLGDEVSERQWNDVLGVLRIQAGSLDRLYLGKWAAELGVADLLEKAWREAEI